MHRAHSFLPSCKRLTRHAALAALITLPTLGGLAAAATGNPTVGSGAAGAGRTAAQCAATTGCEAKFCRIQLELDQAQTAGNKRRADGLRTALAQARASCTPESLKADQAREIAEKEQEVSERESEVREARAGGKARKIDKAEKKLREAQQELQEARAAIR